MTPLLQTLDTSAMMVVSKGQVVYEYGDLAKLSYLASCRKSVLAMLYGNYVVSGKIPLHKTLRDFVSGAGLYLVQLTVTDVRGGTGKSPVIILNYQPSTTK